MKTCPNPTCEASGKPQPLENFTKDRSRVDSLNPWCRGCTRASGRRWHKKNKADVAARKAKQYEADPRRFLSRNNRWRSENRERERTANRRYYWNNVERVAEWHSIYYQANKDVCKEGARRRRAHELGVVTLPFTPNQLAARWAYYGNRCWVCRELAAATDHVKPISKGGGHMLCNLRPICTRCNSSKGAKWPLEEWCRDGVPGSFAASLTATAPSAISHLGGVL